MSRFAFIAGSNGPGWDQRLQYAERDAERMGTCLASDCSFTVETATRGADAHDVMRAMSRVAAACQVGDELIVYFSGHGVLLGGRLFLLWDTTSDRIFDSALNARHMVDVLDLSMATHKLLVLDCCHAGGAVGFKGGDLQPVLTDGGSQLVLCASARLELAREFDDFGGSFIAHHTLDVLGNATKRSVLLTELVDELARRAERHNATNPLHRVPAPYLFGEQKSPFIIKRPKGASPVELSIRGLFEPDMPLFRDTLRPYVKWNIAYILNELPVHVTLPPLFSERIAMA